MAAFMLICTQMDIKNVQRANVKCKRYRIYPAHGLSAFKSSSSSYCCCCCNTLILYRYKNGCPVVCICLCSHSFCRSVCLSVFQLVSLLVCLFACLAIYFPYFRSRPNFVHFCLPRFHLLFFASFHFLAGEIRKNLFIERRGGGAGEGLKEWHSRSLQCADKSIRTDRLRGTCFAFQFSAWIVYFAFTPTSTFISFLALVMAHASYAIYIFIYEKIIFIGKRFAHNKMEYIYSEAKSDLKLKKKVLLMLK